MVLMICIYIYIYMSRLLFSLPSLPSGSLRYFNKAMSNMARLKQWVYRTKRWWCSSSRWNYGWSPWWIRCRRTQATNNGQHFLNVGMSKRIKKNIIMSSHCRAYKGAQAPDKLRHHNTFLVKGWLERKSASNRLFFFWQKLKETVVNHGFSRQMLVWTRFLNMPCIGFLQILCWTHSAIL